jgi:peptidoglycan/xylan/chitin deacetylase (PgdA/CDA1 family)
MAIEADPSGFEFDHQESVAKMRSLAAAEHAGAAHIRAYVRDSVPLRELQLGTFGQGRAMDVVVRRLVLAANLPADVLDRAGTQRSWLTSYAYWRGVQNAIEDRQSWQRLTRAPIVLLYHALAAEDEGPSRYVLPARRFAQHMRWLHARRYTILGLDDLLTCLRANRLPPARSVVITFDDAYTDTFGLAFPILRRFGFAATVFAVSGRVGAANDWEPSGPLANRPMCTWAQLRQMRAAGIQIGAHSRSHPSLPAVSARDAEDEIRDSRAELEYGLSCSVQTFAYPFGHTDESVQPAVERAGYLGAVGVQPGVCDPCVSTLEVPRIEMQGTWRLSHFALALHLGHVPRALA